MRIVRLDTWIVSVPYLRDEISSRVARGGVTDTIVRLTADNGHECYLRDGQFLPCRRADFASSRGLDREEHSAMCGCV
jgi:hypothetical protein